MDASSLLIRFLRSTTGLSLTAHTFPARRGSSGNPELSNIPLRFCDHPPPFFLRVPLSGPVHFRGLVFFVGALLCIFSCEAARFSGLFGASAGRSDLLWSMPPVAVGASRPSFWPAWSLCLMSLCPDETAYRPPMNTMAAPPRRLGKRGKEWLLAMPRILDVLGETDVLRARDLGKSGTRSDWAGKLSLHG